MRYLYFSVFIIIIWLFNPVFAGNETIKLQGMRITHQLSLPGSPEKIYDAITGDISGWWDHSFSKKPLKFYIEAKPGGGFFEIFDETGDGVQHATITFAQRGKLLRFEGPLGLSGKAIHLMHTYEFSPIGSDSTNLKLTVNGIGELNQELITLVDQVWYHFLFDRFKPFVEGGFQILE